MYVCICVCVYVFAAWVNVRNIWNKLSALIMSPFRERRGILRTTDSNTKTDSVFTQCGVDYGSLIKLDDCTDSSKIGS